MEIVPKSIRFKPVFIFFCINLLAIFVFLINSNQPIDFKNLSLFSIFLFTYLFYMYAINSYSDFREDKIAKKIPKTENKQSIKFITILAGGISVIFAMILSKNLEIGVSIFILYFLSTFYSLEPLRLKTKGVLGPLVSALCQAPLPYIIFSINYYEKIDFFIFIWLFLFMFIIEISQQLVDFNNDSRSKTRTLAIKLGRKKTRTILKILLAIFLVFNLINIVMNFNHNLYPILALALVPLLFFGYLSRALGSV